MRSRSRTPSCAGDGAEFRERKGVAQRRGIQACSASTLAERWRAMLLLLRMSDSEPPTMTAPARRRTRGKSNPLRHLTTPLGASGITVTVIIAACVFITREIGALATEVAVLKQKVETHLDWHRSGVGSPVGSATRTIRLLEDPTLESRSSPTTPVSSPSAIRPPPPTVSALPADVESAPIPACVARRTYHKFPCESATRCFPSSRFKPELLAALREKFGTSDVRVCE